MYPLLSLYACHFFLSNKWVIYHFNTKIIASCDAMILILNDEYEWMNTSLEAVSSSVDNTFRLAEKSDKHLCSKV